MHEESFPHSGEHRVGHRPDEKIWIKLSELALPGDLRAHALVRALTAAYRAQPEKTDVRTLAVEGHGWQLAQFNEPAKRPVYWIARAQEPAFRAVAEAMDVRAPQMADGRGAYRG